MSSKSTNKSESKSILDYMPASGGSTSLVQARVPLAYALEAKRLMRVHGHKLSAIMSAALQAYIAEMQNEKEVGRSK